MNEKDVEGFNALKNKALKESSPQESKKGGGPDKPKKIRRSLRSEIFTIICIGQVCIIIILVMSMVMVNLKSKSLDIDIKDWKSDYIKIKDGTWYADSNLVPTDEEIDLLRSPEISIDKASYVVTVDYECTSLQTCYAITTDFIKSSRARMASNRNSASFCVDVNQSVSNFEIVIRYNGKGLLKINNVTVCEDHSRLGRILVYMIILFAVCDIWYFFSDKIRKNRTIIMSLIGIVFLSSLPLFVGGIGRGHDLGFHIIRIEALADSLRRGVFPNRVSTLWFDGYGYPASIYYGDILLYLSAVMRLLGFTVTTAYKAYILFVNIGTALFGYLCFNGMFKNKYSALLAALVYSTTTYRYVNIYIRSAVGEYTAMMFLPLVAYGICKIYTEDMTKPKEYLKSSTVLALGMAGLIGCHILSTEMVCFVLFIVCLVLIRKTVKPATLRALGIAILETALLSAYFIVPFLDYYINVNVRINDLIDENTPFIQGQGCSIAEYFAVFRDVFTIYSVHQNQRLATTPGFILMIALIVGMAVLVYQKKGKRSRKLAFYFGFSVLSLYLASDIFPWNTLSARTAVGKMLAQVQFPWRYVSIAVVFMTFVFAWLFDKFMDKDFGHLTGHIRLGAFGTIVLAGFFTAAIFTGAYLDDSSFRYWRDTGDLDPWSVSAGEYLLYGFSEDLDGKVNSANMETAEIVERDGSKMILYCEGTDREGIVEVPIFNYKGYVVEDEFGNTCNILNGKNSTIRFKLPKNYRGNVTVDFKVPFYWRIAEFISLVSVLVLCGFFAVNLRKNR